jgi:hypothetical protein
VKESRRKVLVAKTGSRQNGGVAQGIVVERGNACKSHQQYRKKKEESLNP